MDNQFWRLPRYFKIRLSLSRIFISFIIISMTLTAHLALATAVSASARFSLPGAFLFGSISHHLLDFIPHLDAGSFWSVEDQKAGIMPVRVRILILIDVLLSLGYLFWLGWGLKIGLPLLFWASLGAALPDLIVTGFPFFIPKLRDWSLVKQYEKLHYILFREAQDAPSSGYWILSIFSTILIIGVSFWLLLK